MKHTRHLKLGVGRFICASAYIHAVFFLYAVLV